MTCSSRTSLASRWRRLRESPQSRSASPLDDTAPMRVSRSTIIRQSGSSRALAPGMTADADQSDTDRRRHAACERHAPWSQKSLLPRSGVARRQRSRSRSAFSSPRIAWPTRFHLIWWLLIVELLGLVAFPLAFSAFPGLRDRGWGLSKLLGLLIRGLRDLAAIQPARAAVRSLGGMVSMFGCC